MKNSCSPLAPHPASFAPPWGLAREVCPSSVRRLLSGPRLCLCLSPPAPTSVRFCWLLSFSFCPSAQRHKAPSPRTRAHTLTSHQLGKEPSETLSVPNPPRSLCQGPGRPQAPSHSQTQEPREVQPSASWAQRHLPGTCCVPSSPSRGGWGRQLSAGKGSQTPGGEGEMAAQPPAVGWCRVS